ncbi:autotransporter assembly complex protein TamA [Altererythrobacter sp. MF3-039]|uniref:autotransporter assembly complex protein TamA n=1 Tax=Altererythrobacter sp. MF3-039 TaxID=3252901 RepID=UPI00390CCF2D
MLAYRLRDAVSAARRIAFVGACLATLSVEAVASTQDRQQEEAIPAPELSPPPLPADTELPEIEEIISDEEFAQAVPEMEIEDDEELLRSLESIEEFERRLALEEGLEDQDQSEPEGGVIPALADGDPVEEIGDAPIRDAELLEPLPPLASFEVEPVEFAESEADRELLEVEYVTELTGIEDADAQTEISVRDMFNDLSALEKGDGKAANVAQVAARLEEDSQLIERILASEGWYEATISTRIDRSGAANGQPLAALLQVSPGSRYTFSAIEIVAEPTEPTDLISENLALQVGEPIIATRVQGAEAQVAIALPEQGYPFAEVGERDILLDQDTKEGVYTLPVNIGPRARFRGFTTTGDLAFDAKHIDVLARFEPGELYDSRKVDDLRQALVATGLLSTVTVRPQRTGEIAEGATEYVEIAVEQDAGPPRTIAASAGFGTGEGARVSGSWTHRNLFPPEGAVIASATLGTAEQGLSGTFRRANAGRRDRTFEAVAEAFHSSYDAFEAFTGRLAARVSYDSTPIWQKRLTYAYGAQIIGTVEDDFFEARGVRENRTFLIGGLTGQVGFDQSDSLLNPTSGFRLTALVEPEGSLQGNFSPYVRVRLDGSAYYPISDSIVIAGRARVGTIQGAARFDLAPSRRFYAGGGGSVRGFGFQQLGPQSLEPNPRFDPDDAEETDDPLVSRPIGGRSVNEAAAEVRYRFGNFGVVAFVDVGQAYRDEFPDLSDLRIGAGLGARYYTNFGPLRVDIATPLDRRPGESRINLYLSIGQAF